MANRLTRAQSPYLQQHGDNPVDWYEWGEDAFAEARRRDVPLLVSVGYAACHWCHVMAHESFADEATAELMNTGFVNVKVDREERPDVDAVYMAATQAMTGRGGWPMTVFTTPEGTPFLCGTYFPPVPRFGTPSFPQVLEAVSRAWREQRADLERTGERVRAHLAQVAAPAPPAPLDEDVLSRALDTLAASYDARHGGFGGAPKFPPSMVCEWLLRRAARTGDTRALEMAEGTLTAMARGGIYDQLAGGFARYSVDETWTVPHFEKMLYDNALLLRVYTHWWRQTGSPLARRVAEETAGWMLAELRTQEGGFASSLDADSPGGEGAFSVWTPEQLHEALGEEDGAWAAEVWGVTPDGTFEEGASVLQLPADPTDPARYERVRAALHAVREARPRPARDDKVVAAWNGYAVTALAEAGALLERPEWVHAAEEAASLVLRVQERDGRLVRTSRDGAPGTSPAVLEDYAALAEGLLTLHQVTGDAAHLTAAGRLLDTVRSRFAGTDGTVFDTADDATDPAVARLGRPADPADGPTPSGLAVAAGALLTWSALTGDTAAREEAEGALGRVAAIAVRYPRAAGWALATAEAALDGPRQVAVVGDREDARTGALASVARRSSAPGLVLAVGRGAPPQLLEGRTERDGVPTAYACRGFVCDLPTTDPAVLADQLRG
ncbi:thioredoxin domain-containing protein [Georgenia sp. 311]|uniref:thioredoxin domain-containing protein n=1 Tax=Georgenia sp. 311 TaxID=2585134 RepID=UPI001111B98D|nr:thioredoxin domain-containing protein [Georgenia sp. 311]TNC17417.1 thioredoxin domain-containing protein [Georgenia sp. 311]